ncbi:putative disease resistance protein [Vitis vinifera]|uniref:Putative disease resistance protein n=1 Tax=Vitis vinifera TaxID=29760 RepID=A0A438FCB3_VITVI|nr:putative disease resistance protein [Vitis vinifera]
MQGLRQPSSTPASKTRRDTQIHKSKYPRDEKDERPVGSSKGGNGEVDPNLKRWGEANPQVLQVSCCNYFKKGKYANEIKALEDSLLKIFQKSSTQALIPIVVPAKTLIPTMLVQEHKDKTITHTNITEDRTRYNYWVPETSHVSPLLVSIPYYEPSRSTRNNMQILVLLKSNRFSWSNRGVSVKYESLGSCEATDPPAFMVGLDVPLKELKRWLFTDGESRIVVSAPGGCGKPLWLKGFVTTNKSRVLITSRNEFPKFGSTYYLKLLSEEDAKTLFRHSAIPEDGSGSSMPDSEALQGISTGPGSGQSIVNSEDELRNCLQSSLDALDDKDIMLKECFMDLGSFPEDQKIPATALIDMWAELHKLDKDGIYAISNLHKLCSRNLLNLVVTRNDANEIDWCYNDAFVMQHDLLRDLAIYQSNQESIEKRKRLIMDLTGNRLPEWIFCRRNVLLKLVHMELPEAEALILNFNQTENKYELPEFMKQMDKLKVLVVTNYGFCAAELTNFSVLSSLSNLKRIRLEQVSIPTLCNTSMELKNLEKLSLVMCHKIGQAFASSTIQIPEMLPNLREINIDYCNDLVELPEGFCDLVQLNKLSISNCHKLSALPEGIGKLANLEVLRVSACTLVSKLPDSMGSLHKLSVLDITGCLRIRKMPKQIGELRGLRELHMRRCPGLRELPPSVTLLVDLERVICDEETAQLWECYTHLLPNLTLSVPEEIINLNWL